MYSIHTDPFIAKRTMRFAKHLMHSFNTEVLNEFCET